jgi:dTDP-4-dehydrorhamnose reductase
MAKPTSETVWITGAGGLIGNWLVQLAPDGAAGARIIPLTRSDLELTDTPAVRRRFDQERPNLVIHCAALSKSPECQRNPELARLVNVDVTARLADVAAAVPFIFFSSDLVFDGKTGNYDESAAVNPQSVYAETKVAAERVVMANPRHTVVRTSINGGVSPSGERGFNEQMRLAWQSGQTLRLFTDEFRSPIPAPVTARAVWELARSNRPGLYHLAGGERLSRFQIGQLLAPRWPHLNPRFEAASLREYVGAPRSPDTSFNCAKIQALLSFPLPGLTAWLDANPAEVF